MTEICANVPYVAKTTQVRSSKTNLLVESYMMRQGSYMLTCRC